MVSNQVSIRGPVMKAKPWARTRGHGHNQASAEARIPSRVLGQVSKWVQDFGSLPWPSSSGNIQDSGHQKISKT